MPWDSDTHFLRLALTSNKRNPFQKALARALLTTFQITDITFVRELDFMAGPASPKRPTTESATRPEHCRSICLCTAFPKLDDGAVFLGKVLGSRRSCNIGRSAMTSNVSSPCVLGGGVAIASNASSKNWGAIGGLQTAFAVLDSVAIHWQQWCIRFELLTTVTSSSHLRYGVATVKWSLMKNFKRELKEDLENEQKDWMTDSRQYPGKIPAQETSLGDVPCRRWKSCTHVG